MGKVTSPAVLKGAGALLIVVGIAMLLVQPTDDGWQNASFPTTVEPIDDEPDYAKWATIVLGFMVWGSGHYFKLRETRRADRAEAREIADRRNRGDDVQ
jgi:hypothetical protein